MFFVVPSYLKQISNYDILKINSDFLETVIRKHWIFRIFFCSLICYFKKQLSVTEICNLISPGKLTYAIQLFKLPMHLSVESTKKAPTNIYLCLLCLFRNWRGRQCSRSVIMFYRTGQTPFSFIAENVICLFAQIWETFAFRGRPYVVVYPWVLVKKH